MVIFSATANRGAYGIETANKRRWHPHYVGRRQTARLKHSQEPKPNPSPTLGPARREYRKRFSRPKNKQSPKPSPVLRPVSASLRLRFRSAAFPRALRDSFSFGLSPKELNRLLRRGARLSYGRVLFFLASRCLRLPRATSAKPASGLCPRYATRFLLAARQFANCVCIALAGSVGCEQKEPKNRRSNRVPSNLFEWPRCKEEGEAKL